MQALHIQKLECNTVFTGKILSRKCSHILHYSHILYNTYLTKEYSSHPESEISILGHQHQSEEEMVLQDSSAQLVTLP